MQANLFQWIREGVRQSVLLGVSDAIEEIGTPDNNNGIQNELQKAIKAGQTATASKSTGRKRLGKSLKELDATAVK